MNTAAPASDPTSNPIRLDSEAHSRVTRLYRYLHELYQLRNPPRRDISPYPWTMWWDDLPVHDLVVRNVPAQDTIDGDGSASDTDGEPLLRVGRPAPLPCPAPPDAIAAWLQSGWEQIAARATYIASRMETMQDAEGETVQVSIRFEDDIARTQAWQAWAAPRAAWVVEQRPAYEALDIFDRLYTLHGALQREGERYEILLCNGILNWRRPEVALNHPLIMMRLELQFDAARPEFTLIPSEQPVRFYSPLFQSLSGIDGKQIAAMRAEVETAQFHPLLPDALTGFLQRVAATLDRRGRFLESKPEGKSGEGFEDYPRLWSSPVLLLADRDAGFAATLDAIDEDLRECPPLPAHLYRIVGKADRAEGADAADAPTGEGGEPNAKLSTGPDAAPDILFSKPANAEQRMIAERLERHGCVLVQGPPGTGKTHTIGNLIGHLLAQGKTVLVTSHTTKALKVLRDQVVAPLRPLCVSVLDSDSESKSQLEASVTSMVEKLSSLDAAQLQKDADKLARRRGDLLHKVAATENAIIEARQYEYLDIVRGGYAYPPSDAARRVAACKNADGWIPGAITPERELPLTPTEIGELYATNLSVSPDEERQFAFALPAPDDLVAPPVFAELLRQRDEALMARPDARPDLWTRATTEGEAATLVTLAAHLRTVAEQLEQAESWELELMERASEQAQRALWNELTAQIRAVEEQALRAQSDLLNHDPVLADNIPLDEQAALLTELIDHTQGGKKLNFLTLLAKPKWRQYLGAAKVKGHEPVTREDFLALQTQAAIRQKRQELGRRWERQMVALGGPAIGGASEEVERFCRRYVTRIANALAWRNGQWDTAQNALRQMGFRVDALLSALRERTDDTAKQHLPTAQAQIAQIENRLALLRLAEAEAQLERLGGTLEAFAREQAEGVVAALRYAVVTRDATMYREAYTQWQRLIGQRVLLTRRQELIVRLEADAPLWASAIRSRQTPHDREAPPGDAEKAWLYAQLAQELDRRLNVSLDTLEHQRVTLTEQLHIATAELAERRAWQHQIARTSATQRQALVGWKNTIRKIGAGSGQRVPLLRREAQKQMQASRSAVPVWIMPLSRVAENFDPRATRFDVVIVDEASQADAMGLIALYLAKSVVVVGDHEQVSPDAVGQRVMDTQNLIDQYLEGIPNAVLYDGQRSVYDIAMEAFGGHICLLEHFRCATEIIQFSNELSYGGKIVPLRETSRVRTRPHVVPHRIGASVTRNKVNEAEAVETASLLLACMEQPEYADATFGMISLLGEEQARVTDTIITKHLTQTNQIAERERRRIICGTPPQFQGDERDVIFLSMVDCAREKKPLNMRGDGANGMYKKRYNVAASRARNQLWIVHSLQPDVDLKRGDIRRRLLEFAQDPLAALRNRDAALQKAESPFEEMVIKRLTGAGYRVVPQWKVGAFRIDMVVVDGDRRLAIECDGDRYHPLEKLAEDMDRQAILERLGWTFARIRGSAFFRNPDEAMLPVFEKLAAMDILPTRDTDDAQEPDAIGAELLSRIRGRAAQLRAEWTPPRVTGVPDSEDPEEN